MTDITYNYSRPRQEFGRIPEFQANDSEILTHIPGNAQLDKLYVEQDPREIQVQNVPSLSEASTNTERVRLKSQMHCHTEGGWPNSVDPTEFEEKMKYCKKVEREEGYLSSCARLVDQCLDKCIKQNDAIEIYGEYFQEDPPDDDVLLGPASMKVVSVLKDAGGEKRAAVGLSWHNDGSKVAVAYSRLRFQTQSELTNTNSSIWDVTNPNKPSETLVTASPLCSIEYYTKDPHFIAGGSWNGTVQYWDTRQPNRPATRSLIEESHKDPVWAVKWLQSKSGELLSVSTDGNVYVWDCRLPDRPTEIHSIREDNVVLLPKSNDNGAKGVLGGLCLDYDPQVGGPAKYMIGTEQGTILSCNRKGKTNNEKIGPNTFNGHHGPVYSVQRNPTFSKFFLSVGDWTARLWYEDFKFMPMYSTFYHKAYLTCGTWHPVRPGVFFTTRMDGYLDVWDLLMQQTTPSLSFRICDGALHTVKPSSDGRYLATGGLDGNVNLVQLPPSLCSIAPDEKSIIGALFENESTRDKNLERTMKEKRAAMRQREQRNSVHANQTSQVDMSDEAIRAMEEEYMNEVNAQKQQDVLQRTEAARKHRDVLRRLEDSVDIEDDDEAEDAAASVAANHGSDEA